MEGSVGVEYTVVEGGVVNKGNAVVLRVVEGAVELKAVAAVGVDDVILGDVVEIGVVDGGVEGVIGEGSVVVVIEGVVVVVLGFGTILGERA